MLKLKSLLEIEQYANSLAAVGISKPENLELIVHLDKEEFDEIIRLQAKFINMSESNAEILVENSHKFKYDTRSGITFNVKRKEDGKAEN